jgi:hypothetical protein
LKAGGWEAGAGGWRGWEAGGGLELESWRLEAGGAGVLKVEKMSTIAQHQVK